MKRSPLEVVLLLACSVFASLLIFHKALGLSDDWQWPLLIAVVACWVPLFILQRRRRNARLAAGLPASEKPPTKRRFWLLVLLMVAVTLSGPLWLPYTGVGLPTSKLIVTSVIGCVFGVFAVILSWRYWNKKV
jgi:hypothetical protein